MVVDLSTPPGTPIIISDDDEPVLQAPAPVPVAPVVPAPAPDVAPVPEPAGKQPDAKRPKLASGKAVRVVKAPPRKAMGPIRDPAPRTPRAATMLLAIKNDNKSLVDELIVRKADVNQQTTLDGVALTPLIAAINAGRMDMVKALIDAGADEHFPQRGAYSAFTVARSLSRPEREYFSQLKKFIKNRDAVKSGVDSLLAASHKIDAEEASGAAKVVGDGGSAVSPNAKVGIPEAAGGTGSPSAYTGDTTEDDDEHATGGSGGQAGPAPQSANKFRAHKVNDEWIKDRNGPWIVHLNGPEPELCPLPESELQTSPPTSPQYSGV